MTEVISFLCVFVWIFVFLIYGLILFSDSEFQKQTRVPETPPPPTVCQEKLCVASWLTVARPVVRYSPVLLALTPAHLPELTRSLPHHLSRRTKCATLFWQSSLKCQPGVTNPCRPLGPRRPGSVGGALPWIKQGARNMPR